MCVCVCVCVCVREQTVLVQNLTHTTAPTKPRIEKACLVPQSCQELTERVSNGAVGRLSPTWSSFNLASLCGSSLESSILPDTHRLFSEV